MVCWSVCLSKSVGINSLSMRWPAGTGPELYKQIVVHCDYCNYCVKTNLKETYTNRPCQCDYLVKRHPSMLVFTNLRNNNFYEAFSYHNEPYKTAVAVKEMINLKHKMDTIIPQK